jgi:hypothetical protein
MIIINQAAYGYTIKLVNLEKYEWCYQADIDVPKLREYKKFNSAA